MGITCNITTPCYGVDTFKADPDIAGIGVIASFFVAAWASYLIAVYTYLFVDGVIEDVSPIARRLDKKIMKFLKGAGAKFITTRFHAKLRRTYPFNKAITKSKMQDICLIFADLQLATGASILITGYIRHCVITQYHFYVISLLGAASFTAFQTLLVIVHEKIQSRLSKFWRLLWIFAIFSCVLITTLIFYNDNFLISYEWGLTMHCFWAEFPGAFTPALMPYVILGVFINSWAFFTILRHLYPGLDNLTPFAGVSRICVLVARLPSRLYLRAAATDQIAGSRQLSDII
ncbi:hypothetical protein NLG97_g5174 [Lecanicillium saksenae]|uniref:Uncharacterized protein n=1 Tax=Lecanicillium saksenae TaxID=468837 RepID=A0ACC1QUY1_9HYPO|nr:hypothetical protein NLG97_g5174 [Lecanicillium saksenae]